MKLMLNQLLLLLFLLLSGCGDDAAPKTEEPAKTQAEQPSTAVSILTDLGITVDQFDTRMSKQLKPYDITLKRGKTDESSGDGQTTGFLTSYPGLEFTVTSGGKAGKVEVINLTSKLNQEQMEIDLVTLFVGIEQTIALLEPELSASQIKDEVVNKLMEGDMSSGEDYEKTVNHNGIEYIYEFSPSTGFAVLVASLS